MRSENRVGGEGSRDLAANQGALLHISPLAVRAGCETDCFRLIQALPQWSHDVLVLDCPAEMSLLWMALGADVAHLDCLDAPLPRFISMIREAAEKRKYSGAILWSITR